ncbi:MAG TPA: thymidylate synthase [Thermoanaerobaculia bacterium]|nr:thymidylate synthase [Thermoanaerobaculia bacterium]
MSKSNSHADEPTVINDTNLSRAWARIFLRVLDGRGSEVSPLVLSLSGFGEEGQISETGPVRNALDQALIGKAKIPVEDVAFTIFPERLWQIARRDRARLFELYKGVFPRYVAMNRRANGRGLYFERLTMFGAGVPCDGNQLEWILSQYNSRPGVRDSMFQAAVFDPARDHVKNARVVFPCLQHVSFVPTGDGLVMNAFYATQYIFDKAYGNYLGLAQLGAFMAHEMSLPLTRLNVTVGVAKLEGVSKSDASLRPIITAAREVLATPFAGSAQPVVALMGAGTPS